MTRRTWVAFSSCSATSATVIPSSPRRSASWRRSITPTSTSAVEFAWIVWRRLPQCVLFFLATYSASVMLSFNFLSRKNSIIYFQGQWNPAMNLASLLVQIQVLLQEPNPKDPLMEDVVSHGCCFWRFWSSFVLPLLREFTQCVKKVLRDMRGIFSSCVKKNIVSFKSWMTF